MEETNQVSINIEESTALLSLSDPNEEIDERFCICRVPQPLRKKNEDAYTPQVISIGPFHHGRKELEAMNEHKQRFLDHFVLKSNKGKGQLLQFVKERETRLRNCYSEVFGLDSETFANMILIDATFIIEFFYEHCFPQSRCQKDRLVNQPYMWRILREDLLLLENQIPFFILEDLFDFSRIVTPPPSPTTTEPREASAVEVHRLFGENQKLSFIKMTYLFFQSYTGLRAREFNPEELDSIIPSVQHLLDFLRTCLLPKKIPERGIILENASDDVRHIRTATELRQAGVQFEKSKSQNYFDIQFDRKTGVLKIPSLYLGSYTESLLRNLVAFEQFYCCEQLLLSDYLILLNRLIDVPKDVDILVEKKILERPSGDSNAASTMLSNVSVGVYFDPSSSYFADIHAGLNAYCRRPWPKWKVMLKQDYFNSPWAAVSVIAAAILLVLTIVQTVFSIKK